MDLQQVGKVTARQAIGQLEFELAHPCREDGNEVARDDGEPAVLTDERETSVFLAWFVGWLTRKSGNVEGTED
jgi:hypothetical protein